MRVNKRQDEGHRAIGHYLVEFSYLVAEMRSGIEYRLEADDPMVIKLVLGEAFADQIANAFFAICERERELDDEERQVAIRLRKEVKDAIKDRNDFAHGDWMVGLVGYDHPTVLRTKPGRRAGASVERVQTVEELDDMAEAVHFLSDTVIEFAWLCLDIHPVAERLFERLRVRDIFRFQKHQVLRTGRYADEYWFHPEEKDPSG